ncbi:glutathione S-transferase family protein [Devosia algicola]|uniref:Glutathione S-transferase family protein n=1 Tax=Devosia algicola TaxID=3026418 RepID=A0ABY7YRU2_9HYPH|nr:glutathione S-transferase family protein [Devosia algicola]WDR04053.1 glutathione S-transferase family protein [Devosia algicola]
MKLFYSTNINPRVAVATARFLKSPVDLIQPDRADAAQMADIKRLNPNGLYPILVEDDGSSLWETDAIACRLSALAGSDFWRTGVEMPNMIRWVSWANIHLNRAADMVMWERVTKQRYNMGAVDQGGVEEGLAGFHAHMPVLDGALARQAWLCGDHISFADFRVGTVLRYHEEAGLPLADYPHVSAWHERLMQIPAWSDTFSGLA